MQYGHAVDAVLHLGAMAIVFASVYLNLDKIRSVRVALVEDLELLQKEVADLFLLVNAIRTKVGGQMVVQDLYDSEDIHFLFWLAGHHARKQYPLRDRARYTAAAHFRAPGLAAIRTGWHSWFIGLLLILCLIAYFDMTAAEAGLPWGLPAILPYPIQFFLYATTILSVVVFALCAHKLEGLKGHYGPLIDKWRKQQRQYDEGQAAGMQVIREFEKEFPDGSRTAPPKDSGNQT